MAGRARGVAVSSASVVVAAANLDRVAVGFTVGDTANSSSLVLKDQEDATATNGVPLAFSGGILWVQGKSATHRWSAIRLAAVDCICGVIEVFEDNFPDGREPDSGHRV